MTLPVWLRPWWPVLKRAHRAVTRLLGALFRALSPLLGARGVPREAIGTSIATAVHEPEAVALHPGRPAQRLERPETIGTPPRHWVFERARAVTVPASYTLEVRDGRLTGEYAATTTPGKVLDHETSPYFGVWDWREHPIFLRPTLGEVERVRGTVLSLATRGTERNYYHFLYDAIGRYGVFRDCLPDDPVDAIVVAHGARYQRQLLELVGIAPDDVRLIQPERGRTVRADRLLVPSNPNWALEAPPATVEWLRSALPPTGRPVEGRRLYLTRGDQPNTRRYVEEPALWPELERRGFLRVDPGTLSVQEQIDLFHAAEVVVAPHGAGLTNVTFSDPSVKVLELFASTYVHLGLWSICQALGATYRYLVAPGNAEPGSPNSGALDDVSIPVDTVLAAVDELIDQRS